METKTKDLGMETHPGEGVMKEEKFSHSRKPSHRHVYGEFWNLRGQHNQEKEKNSTECAPHRNYKQRQRRGTDVSTTRE